jgi:hypothetical protein
MLNGLRRSAPVIVVTVVVAAGLQALLVALAGIPSSDAGYMLMAVASLAVSVATIGVLATAIAAGVEPDRGLNRAVPTGSTWGWAALVGVGAFLAAILLPVLVPVVLVFGLVSLPAIAAGGSASTGFRALQRHAMRSAVVVLVSIVVVSLGWPIALSLGLFATGWLGAAITWLVFGALAAVLLAWWTVRALPSGD